MKVRNTPRELNAALLKDRCTIKAPTTTPDGRGGFVTTYDAGIEVWCGTDPKAKSRLLQVEQLINQDFVYLYIRYGITINPSYIVAFQGADYVINSITNIDNRYQYYLIEMFTKKL
jgi:SPP1 family predicted phage head-tail adaptor